MRHDTSRAAPEFGARLARDCTLADARWFQEAHPDLAAPPGFSL